MALGTKRIQVGVHIRANQTGGGRDLDLKY